MLKHLFLKSAILTVVTMLLCLPAQAAKITQNKTNHAASVAAKALAYSVPSESRMTGSAATVAKVPLGSLTYASSGSASPGLTFGWTWYDNQHNGSMGRMIETGPHSGETGTDRIVHMGWMYSDDDRLDAFRGYAYAAYKSENGSMVGPVVLHEEPARGGYVNIDVTPDNRALVGGHFDDGVTDLQYATEIFFDGGPAYATFPNSVRVPDSTMAYGQVNAFEAIWPKFFFQFGTDTVLHIVAEISETPDRSQQAIMYFRKVGFENGLEASWDYPPYVVDTVATLAHDITGERTSDRVAIGWTASLPYQDPFCDTCSGLSVYDGYLIGQMDNDVYYQESFDQGANFEPRVNVTQCAIGEAAYKAYADLTMLYDGNGSLHLVWPACPWAADLCVMHEGWCWENDWIVNNARLLHWSENIPYVRTIADQVFDAGDPAFDSCWAGAWNLIISKPAISECDGKLYAIWTQFNDPRNGIINDCAEWGYDENNIPEGAANGDLWVSVSEDWGMTWDAQRNLTNSYSPHCDPKHADDCQSDNWASMNRFGHQNQPGENWMGAIVLDPSGGAYSGDYYLDIQYVEDRDAGAVVQDEGSWTNNPLNWFRMPCVEPGPPPVPIFWASWGSLGPPAYVMPGEQFDTTLTIQNRGGSTLEYTITVIEDNGPPGWLDVSGFSGSIPSGLANWETGTVHLNVGGVVTEFGDYYGRLHFEGNDPYGLPADIEIHMWVHDAYIPPEWDVVNTNCLALAASNNGNMGHSGEGKVNMDYYPEDCDSTAKIYMYDGSPLYGRIVDDDTLFNSAIWGVRPYESDGFMPSWNATDAKYCPALDAEVYETGDFASLYGSASIEKIYVAPQSDCNFIIQHMRVWSATGLPQDDIMLGEAIDWDIPTDQLGERTAANYGSIDGPRNLVYIQGYEAYGAGGDTLYPYNCTDNSMRFGGQAFVESYLNDAMRYTMAYSGFVGENDSLQTGNGFEPGTLYWEMAQAGFRGTDSVEDLHTVLCFEPALDLGGYDVYEAVTVLATIENGTLGDFQAAIDAGKAWYHANGGMDMFDDLNADGMMDLCESCCVEMGKFYNDGQPYSILDIDNWIYWMFRDPEAPPPDCPEQLDIAGGTECVMAGDVCIYPDGQVDILDLIAWIECLLIYGSCPTECP